MVSELNLKLINSLAKSLFINDHVSNHRVFERHTHVVQIQNLLRRQRTVVNADVVDQTIEKFILYKFWTMRASLTARHDGRSCRRSGVALAA